MKRIVGGTKWWQVRGIRGYEPSFLHRSGSLTFGIAKIFMPSFRLDAEWISAKKDWQEAQRRAKEHGSVDVPQEHTAERSEPGDPISSDVVSEPPPKLEGEASHQSTASKSKETSRDSAAYQPEMDEMRCILYAHGGMVTLIS